MSSNNGAATVLDNSDSFVRRHIGPRPEDGRKMLEALGLAGMDDLIDKTVPASIRMSGPLKIGEAHSEYAVLRQIAGACFTEHDLPLVHRDGISRLHHTCGNPAQYSGKSGLVYAVHPVSVRNFAGTPGSAAEFPDNDRGFDRIGNCKRISSG